MVQEFKGPYLRVEGIEKPLLNMANFDFLGMGQRKELKEAAVLALDKARCRVHMRVIYCGDLSGVSSPCREGGCVV